jgi:hypothetical protein
VPQGDVSMLQGLTVGLGRGLEVLGPEGPIAPGLAVLLSALLGHRRDLPGIGSNRTVRVALPMLPPEIQQAISAALREREAPPAPDASAAARAGRDKAPRPAPAAAPPYLFVVRSDQSGTFSALRELAWSRPDLLGVAFDRRWMGERRSRRDPGWPERRRGERRRPEPEPSWSKLGFVLTRSAAPIAPAAAGATPSLGLPTAVGADPPPSVPPPERKHAWPPPGRASSGRVEAARRIASRRAAARRPRVARRAMAVGLGILLLLSAAAVANLYVRSGRLPAGGPPPTPTGPAPAPGPPPAADRPGPAPSTSAEPSRAGGPTPGARVPPSPPAPPPPSAVPREPASAPTSAAPAEMAGVSPERCVTPPSPMVAVAEREVLGPVVGVRLDAKVEPPRCLYVVEREGGVLWAVDAARAQLLPR